MKIAFRACLIALLALLQLASAADAPKPDTLETLRATVESLKANLEQVRLEFQYQMQICQAPDVMQARLATIQARQREEALKAKPVKPPEEKP